MTQRRKPNQIERLLCQHGTAFRENKTLVCIKAKQDTRQHMIQILQNFDPGVFQNTLGEGYAS